MASERKTGLGSLPAGLLRPTTPPEPVIGPEAADEELDLAEGQGRGESSAKARAPRAKAAASGKPEKIEACKLYLPEGVRDRLWLLARQRKTTVSAVAASILDRGLPQYEVKRLARGKAAEDPETDAA